MIIQTTRDTTETTVLELDLKDIIEFLKIHPAMKDKKIDLHSLECFVRVPGGGDWSNTNLDIEDHPIQVKFVSERIAS